MSVKLDNGWISCMILPFGATLQSLMVPDWEGNKRDVVLGYESRADYAAQDGYLGATVGRFANRIGGAKFSLHGRDYPLVANNGANHLHGGRVGFSHRDWTVEEVTAERARFSLFSPDGEEGYPGDLRVWVTYALEGAALCIRYEAVSDADTPCSLTNHSYFNLAGHGSVAEQELMLCADHYTPVDEGLIYTGYTDEIPTWLQPYLAAAVRSGFTAGLEDPEVFDPGRIITTGEASVMIANALELAEVFSSDEEAPVTRGMAAMALYRTAKELENRKIDTVI